MLGMMQIVQYIEMCKYVEDAEGRHMNRIILNRI